MFSVLHIAAGVIGGIALILGVLFEEINRWRLDDLESARSTARVRALWRSVIVGVLIASIAAVLMFTALAIGIGYGGAP